MGILPPQEALEIPIQNAREKLLQGTSNIPSAFLKVSKTCDGEMVSYYEGHPLPRKGLTYYEALQATNQVKRITLMLFLPIASLKQCFRKFSFLPLIESLISNYVRLVNSIYDTCERVPYLKKDLYANYCKAVWEIIKVFLEEIGLNSELANLFGKIIATQLQYDDVYRMPGVDAFSSLSLEEALSNPRKFVKRFIEILSKRSVNQELTKKFKGISYLLEVLLLFPKYSKAFKKAISSVPFRWLQYDKYDYYWSLNMATHNYQGRTFEDRFNEQSEIIMDYLKKESGREVTKIIVNDKEIKFKIL